jgi:hypothetical protein
MKVKSFVFPVMLISYIVLLLGCPPPDGNPVNKAPVASFPDVDYIVFDEGTDAANGMYKENGTSGNMLNEPKYDKISGTVYYIYQFGEAIAGNAMWAIHTGIVSYPTAVADVTYYIEDSATIPPDTGWTSGNPGTDPAPTVHSFPIGGDTSVFGNELTGYYSYSDPDGDAEGTSEYQWYRGIGATGPWIVIGSATSVKYTTVAADDTNYLIFEVTPVDKHGKAWTAVSCPPIQINPS